MTKAVENVNKLIGPALVVRATPYAPLESKTHCASYKFTVTRDNVLACVETLLNGQ